jgi:NTP pyrophosphatase (non-canonical NTP hydrolase)
MDCVLKEFENLINRCCSEKIDITRLSNIDIFCVLLNLRIMCISQTFDFESTMTKENEKVKRTQKLDLYDILDKVTNHHVEYIRDVDVEGKYKISLGIPKGFRVDDINTLIVDVIDTIELLGMKYDMSNLTVDEKTHILDELPGDVLTLITSHIRQLDELYKIKVFESVHTGNLSKIHLKLFDNSLFEFIKAMYSCNLQEQYYIRYIMVKRMGFTLRDVDEITPIDTQNYINLFREELEEERKAQEKQNEQSKPGISLPNPGMSS